MNKAMLSGLLFVAGIVLVMILTSCTIIEPEQNSYFVDGEPPAADVENINRLRDNAYHIVSCMGVNPAYRNAIREVFADDENGAEEFDRVFARGDLLAEYFMVAVEELYQLGAPNPALTIVSNSDDILNGCEFSRF